MYRIEEFGFELLILLLLVLDKRGLHVDVLLLLHQVHYLLSGCGEFLLEMSDLCLILLLLLVQLTHFQFQVVGSGGL